MDAIAQGTPTAALTLQSVVLQALMYHGAMTPADATHCGLCSSTLSTA
jgi:hypothetical protein